MDPLQEHQAHLTNEPSFQQQRHFLQVYPIYVLTPCFLLYVSFFPFPRLSSFSLLNYEEFHFKYVYIFLILNNYHSYFVSNTDDGVDISSGVMKLKLWLLLTGLVTGVGFLSSE